MIKSIFQALGFAAAVLASVPALAEDRPREVRVHYGDLDLSDPAAVRTLNRRLARAVEAACPSKDGVRELSQLRGIELCRADKRAEIAPLRAAVLAAHAPSIFAAR